MAKLSAHGFEVCRYEKAENLTNDVSLTWKRKTYAIMSDGRIMSKNDAKFKPSPWEDKPRSYSWGWKRGKLVAETDFKTIEGIVAFLEGKGYAKV